MHRPLTAVLAATMLLLAGCTGAPLLGGSDESAEQATGSIDFYVSDERNAIDEFEHLNVTITEVGLHRAGADGENATATPANETDANETEDGEWVTRDVNDTTVDLTELQGTNATLLAQFNVSNGTYDKVFIHVSEVEGVLKSGNSTDVKLPSDKLHVNTAFTVEANESVNFVYDVTVVKAGQSGKYVIKPVVSETGTDVPITEVEHEGSLSARFLGSVERGGTATVKVTSDGEPVSGATVRVDGETYRTAGDGTVAFDVPENTEELEVVVEYQGTTVELKRTFPDADGERDGSGDGASGDRGNRSRLVAG